MERSRKVELLKRIRSGEAHPLELEPNILIFCNHELPENEHRYYILKNNSPVEISREMIDRINTKKIFFDLEDMNA